MFLTFRNLRIVVNCRVGSLEIANSPFVIYVSVNCRVGSLEIQTLVILSF